MNMKTVCCSITFTNTKKNKKSSDRNEYPAYNKLKIFHTKIRKLSDKLKDTYGITIGTNHPQCAETPDPIIKFADYNRRKIQNYTSIYQMRIRNVSSALIISRRPFAFIK